MDLVRPAVLYNLGVVGVPTCYHTIEFVNTLTPNITVWPTWLRKEDLTDAQTGRRGSFDVMSGGEHVYIGNMLIPELGQGLPI